MKFLISEEEYKWIMILSNPWLRDWWWMQVATDFYHLSVWEQLMLDKTIESDNGSFQTIK